MVLIQNMLKSAGSLISVTTAKQIQSVRFRKSISKEVTERHMDPEHHATQSSMMNLISIQETDHLYVTTYGPAGFETQNNLRVFGPTVFFPRTCLKWNVLRPTDINEKSLGLFTLLTPKLDMLVIGVGSQPYQLPKDVIAFLRKKRINFEVYTTEHAIATFNFLNNDQRWVAAAIIPPEPSGREDLVHYIEAKYKNILDVSSLPIEDEIELRRLGGKDADKVKKLLGDSEELEGNEPESNEDIIPVSPLGAPTNFMAGNMGSVDRSKEESVSGELTENVENAGNKQIDSEVETEAEKPKK